MKSKIDEFIAESLLEVGRPIINIENAEVGTLEEWSFEAEGVGVWNITEAVEDTIHVQFCSSGKWYENGFWGVEATFTPGEPLHNLVSDFIRDTLEVLYEEAD